MEEAGGRAVMGTGGGLALNGRRTTSEDSVDDGC